MKTVGVCKSSIVYACVVFDIFRSNAMFDKPPRSVFGRVRAGMYLCMRLVRTKVFADRLSLEKIEPISRSERQNGISQVEK